MTPKARYAVKLSQSGNLVSLRFANLHQVQEEQEQVSISGTPLENDSSKNKRDNKAVDSNAPHGLEEHSRTKSPKQAKGGAPEGGSTLAPVKAKTTFRINDVDSVGVASLDAEHEVCIYAIKRLAQTRKLEHLQAMHRSVATHFEHEEQMLKQHGFGANVPDEFSPLRSHTEDHTRILRLIEEEINRKKAACGTALACSLDFVQRVADEFHSHADKFDSQYSELLIEAGAQ